MSKKQLIIEKALELFAKNGIEATSIQQITEKCGISKGAFYLSFKSKDELIFGLIDYFMSEFIANIEQSVNERQPNDHLLYNFYHTIFHTFQKHSYFANILIREQLKSLNLELLERMNKYNEFLNAIIFTVVERQFPRVNELMRADLVYIIKAFMKQYGELFFISNYRIDLAVLCHALVEKTTVIAEHTTIPFISTDILSSTNAECLSPTKEELIDLLTKKKTEVTDSIVQQSIELLQHNLTNQQLSPAIIQGLLKNVREDSHCKWVAYLYELYVKRQMTVS